MREREGKRLEGGWLREKGMEGKRQGNKERGAEMESRGERKGGR